MHTQSSHEGASIARIRTPAWVLAACASLAVACSDAPVEPELDAAPIAPPPDASPADANMPDGGVPDVAPADASPPDATLVTVTIEVEGTGHGRVIDDQAGIDCSAVCVVSVPVGTTLSLTAIADADSDFMSWHGNIPESPAPAIELQVAGESYVFARFERAVDLLVSVDGPGQAGSFLANIDCPGDCTTRVLTPATISLIAHQPLGARFDGWSGACTGTNWYCRLELDASSPAQLDVAARFSVAHRFSRGSGGSGSDAAMDVAVSAQGDVAAVGHFGSHAWIAVYAANGSVRFSQVFTATAGYSRALAVVFDAAGNLFVGGFFTGTVALGGDPLVSVSDYDIFLASFTPDGRHRFSQRYGTADGQSLNELAVASDGSVLLAGWFWGTLSFGGTPLVSAGGADAFLARLAPDGSAISAHRFGDAAGDEELLRVVPLADQGAIVLGGMGMGGWLAHIDAGGNELWNQPIQQELSHWGFDRGPVGLGVTPTGDIILGAHVDFADARAYVARYTGEGALADETIIEHLRIHELIVDHAGDIVLVGEGRDGVDLGGGRVLLRVYPGILIAKLDASFDHRWSLGFETRRIFQTVFAVAVAPSGTIAMGGENLGVLDFGGGPIGVYDASSRDPWVAVFNP